MRREFTPCRDEDRINQPLADWTPAAAAGPSEQDNPAAGAAIGRLNILARRQARWDRRALRG